MANDTQVLIVGGGPTGLTLAGLLARNGVRSVLFERDPSTTGHPQAHVVNTRSMEILRSLEIDQAVLKHSLPPAGLFVRWVTDLAGHELANLNMIASGKHALARMTASPTVTASCAQDRVEAALAPRVAELGADVRFGHRVTDLKEIDGGVEATAEGPEGPVRVTADYAVGCDGAGSATRKRLEIDMEGIGVLGHVVNVYFHADLSEIIADRQATLYWVLNAVAPSVLIAMDGRERWSLHLMFGGGREELEKFTPEVCERLARAAIGADVDIDLRGAKPWTMTAEVAARYREGRIFLAGDAAHRFPPTGGFGMNTGIQDAHNLAWKIAAVEGGRASEKLLDTYEAERKPVAERNTEWSVANAIGISEITGPGAIALASEIASGELSLEKASSAIQAIADREAGHFDALALDLGFAYEAGAVVPDGTDLPAVEDPNRDFAPCARPGSRAPHLWFDRNGSRASSLDLFDDKFTLLAGPGEGAQWRDAAGGCGADIDVLVVGDDLDDADGVFADLYGVGTGAVLVRPDGHVAWRAAELPGDPGAALRDAMGRVLPA